MSSKRREGGRTRSKSPSLSKFVDGDKSFASVLKQMPRIVRKEIFGIERAFEAMNSGPESIRYAAAVYLTGRGSHGAAEVVRPWLESEYQRQSQSSKEHRDALILSGVVLARARSRDWMQFLRTSVRPPNRNLLSREVLVKIRAPEGLSALLHAAQAEYSEEVRTELLAQAVKAYGHKRTRIEGFVRETQDDRLSRVYKRVTQTDEESTPRELPPKQTTLDLCELGTVFYMVQFPEGLAKLTPPPLRSGNVVADGACLVAAVRTADWRLLRIEGGAAVLMSVGTRLTVLLRTAQARRDELKVEHVGIHTLKVPEYPEAEAALEALLQEHQAKSWNSQEALLVGKPAGAGTIILGWKGARFFPIQFGPGGPDRSKTPLTKRDWVREGSLVIAHNPTTSRWRLYEIGSSLKRLGECMSEGEVFSLLPDTAQSREPGRARVIEIIEPADAVSQSSAKVGPPESEEVHLDYLFRTLRVEEVRASRAVWLNPSRRFTAGSQFPAHIHLADREPLRWALCCAPEYPVWSLEERLCRRLRSLDVAETPRPVLAPFSAMYVDIPGGELGWTEGRDAARVCGAYLLVDEATDRSPTSAELVVIYRSGGTYSYASTRLYSGRALPAVAAHPFVRVVAGVIVGLLNALNSPPAKAKPKRVTRTRGVTLPRLAPHSSETPSTANEPTSGATRIQLRLEDFSSSSRGLHLRSAPHLRSIHTRMNAQQVRGHYSGYWVKEPRLGETIHDEDRANGLYLVRRWRKQHTRGDGKAGPARYETS